MSPIHTYCSLPSCREARNETAPSYLLPTTRSRSHYRSKMQNDNRPSNSSNQLATRLYIMPILDYSETIIPGFDYKNALTLKYVVHYTGELLSDLPSYSSDVS